MLKRLSVLNIFVAHWLVSVISVSTGRNRFAGEENINLLFGSCSGPSVKKQWREIQEAQLYCFRGLVG